MKATRTTAAVLSAAMAATLLAGCGGSSATSTAPPPPRRLDLDREHCRKHLYRCGRPHRREKDSGVLVSLR